MSLLKTELRRIIKKELGDFLKQYGYKFNSKAEGFIRSFEGGFNQIGVAVFDYRPKFLVSPFFLIRLDKVEQIVQKHVFVLEQYKDTAYTINTGIEHFTGVKEYDIRTEVQLYEVLRQVMDVYSSKVDFFLKYYSDIKNLDKALNDERLALNKLVEPDNRIRAMIIARLNGNRDFEKIAEGYYQSYVQEYDQGAGDEARRLRETIDYLKAL
jgi:hypothetical protein